jgi:hypothetical protein
VIPSTWRYAWHNSAVPGIAVAHGWADTLVSARPRVVRSAADADELVLAYGGVGQGTAYVLDFLEQQRGGAAVRDARRTSWAALAAGTAVPDADLLAVGYPAGRPLPRPTRHALVLPFRVTLGVPVAPDPDAVLARLSRKARQQHVRELRSLDRTLTIGAGRGDFESFYHDMHLPTMVRRHGAATRTESVRTAWECLFQHGKLFFLEEAGRPVAGMLCRLDGPALVIRLAGVRDGEAESYASATYLALYVLILQWAAAHGVTHVDLSGCEPFLSKGIFQFKRKMHPEVTLPRNHFRAGRLLLRARLDRPVVRDFLVANPMVTFGAGTTFEATYFHDDDRPPRLGLRWESPGIARHRLLHLDEFLAGLPRDRSGTAAHAVPAATAPLSDGPRGDT